MEPTNINLWHEGLGEDAEAFWFGEAYQLIQGRSPYLGGPSLIRAVAQSEGYRLGSSLGHVWLEAEVRDLRGLVLMAATVADHRTRFGIAKHLLHTRLDPDGAMAIGPLLVALGVVDEEVPARSLAVVSEVERHFDAVAHIRATLDAWASEAPKRRGADPGRDYRDEAETEFSRILALLYQDGDYAPGLAPQQPDDLRVLRPIFCDPLTASAVEGLTWLYAEAESALLELEAVCHLARPYTLPLDINVERPPAQDGAEVILRIARPIVVVASTLSFGAPIQEARSVVTQLSPTEVSAAVQAFLSINKRQALIDAGQRLKADMKCMTSNGKDAPATWASVVEVLESVAALLGVDWTCSERWFTE